MASRLWCARNRSVSSLSRMPFWVMMSQSTSTDFPRRFDPGSLVSSLSRMVGVPFVAGGGRACRPRSLDSVFDDVVVDDVENFVVVLEVVADLGACVLVLAVVFCADCDGVYSDDGAA